MLCIVVRGIFSPRRPDIIFCLNRQQVLFSVGLFPFKFFFQCLLHEEILLIFSIILNAHATLVLCRISALVLGCLIRHEWPRSVLCDTTSTDSS